MVKGFYVTLLLISAQLCGSRWTRSNHNEFCSKISYCILEFVSFELWKSVNSTVFVALTTFSYRVVAVLWKAFDCIASFSRSSPFVFFLLLFLLVLIFCCCIVSRQKQVAKKRDGKMSMCAISCAIWTNKKQQLGENAYNIIDVFTWFHVSIAEFFTI